MADQIPTNLPFITNQVPDVDNGAVGGTTRKFLAAGTLLIGDVVYISAALTVQKSVTNANYAAFMGIIVGGFDFDPTGACATLAADVGKQAATVGEWVQVLIEGIGLIKSDGAILAGSLVIPDATVAGECDVAAANPGYTLGIALEAIPDGSAGKMFILQSYNEV